MTNQSFKILFSDTILAQIPGIKLGVIKISSGKVRENSGIVSSQFVELGEFIKTKFSKNPPSSDPVVSAVRRMYRRVGWEPTKYRPSSEAMIRRFLKGIGLYRINNFVDLGNVASTRFHLPMGLYDADKINGNIIIDVGRQDEAYEGISKDLIHATGKLILRDDAGIFGNPTADSKRTSLSMSTTNILAIFFTPPEVAIDYLNETLNFIINLYQIECPQLKTEINRIY